MMLRRLITAVVGAFNWVCRYFGQPPWMVVLCAILLIVDYRAFNNFMNGDASLMEAVTGAIDGHKWHSCRRDTDTEEPTGSRDGRRAVAAARAAFPTLTPEGLNANPFFKENWQRIAHEASKQSSAVTEEFYREMQHTHRRLVYILRAIGDDGERLRNLENNTAKDAGSWFQWSRSAEPKLGPEKAKLQRMVRHFWDILQQVSSAYSRFQKDINTVDLALSTIVLQDEKTDKNPFLFFGEGIVRINERFDSKGASSSSASYEKGKECKNGNGAISPDDPEAATFIQNLHTVHIVGSLFHSSFSNARVRLKMLAEAMEKQAEWAEFAKSTLGMVDSALRDQIAPPELVVAIEGVVGLAEELRVMIEESFFRKDE
ncbi:hypothetical protein F5144DRAFT_602968 [Chaetomium tenue]|uniref:Uncharacterized protein n=1 Tax=Chaetomium tenue TaxID=1854479 RepID=A0ACB7P7C8_9PEZI|nr:hypothetical protein F5144DRAFT_602968 [Chaetomium globosum]